MVVGECSCPYNHEKQPLDVEKDLDGANGSESNDVERALAEKRDKLTFVSHAGEEKHFVRDLLKRIDKTNVAAFFDDDMSVCSSAGNEMVTRAAEADQAVVVLSRSFLTKKWAMDELSIFIKKQVKMYPLYYGITPDELKSIVALYDRHVGDGDGIAFRARMKRDPAMWRSLMNEIAPDTGCPDSRVLPDPLSWRENLQEIGKLTGLRRQEFDNDESRYMQAIARMVSPPQLPKTVPVLSYKFIRPSLVDTVVSKLHGSFLGNDTARHVVLTGMGGSGKTLIASAVVRDKTIRRLFDDGVLWMTDQPGEPSTLRLLNQLNALACQFENVVLARHHRQGNTFQYVVDKFDTPRKAQEFFLMWKRKLDLKCLLVVDSAWNQGILQVACAIGFHVLATTRDTGLVQEGGQWRKVLILSMGEEDSLNVLKKYSGDPSNMPRQWALEVAKDCAFHPQTLAIAGSTLLSGDTSLSTDAWRRLHTRLVDKAGVQTTSTLCLRGRLNPVLDVSYDEMGRRQRAHFLALAVLPSGVSVPKKMLSRLWDEDLADTQVAARDLIARSLLEVHVDGYLVHDVLLEYARSRIESPLAGDAAKRQAQYLSGLDVLEKHSNVGEFTSDGFYSLVCFWGSLVKLDPHLKPKHFYMENLASVAEVQHWMHAVHVLRLMADYEGAAALLEGLVSMLENGRAEPEDLMQALSYLSFVTQIQGKFEEAAILNHGVLELSKRYPEVKIPPEALSNMANTLAGQGRFDAADGMFTKIVSAMRETMSSDDPRLLRTLDNMAVSLMHQDKLDEAGRIFCEITTTLKESVGEQHPDYASVLHNRATLLSHQKNVADAMKMYYEALAIRKSVLGPVHPDTLRTLTSVAYLLAVQGEYTEANEMFARVAGALEKYHGGDDLELAHTLHFRARALIFQKKYDEAELVNARASSIWKACYEEKHRLVLMGDLTQAWTLMGRENYEESARIMERVGPKLGTGEGGETPPLILQTLKNIEQLKSTRPGNIDFSKGVLSAEGSGGVDDGVPRRCLFLIEQGIIDEAVPLYEEWFASAQTHLGPTHVTALSLLFERAEVFIQKGEHDDAETFLRLAVRIAEDMLAGVFDQPVELKRSIVKLRVSLSTVLFHKRMFVDAELLLRQCLKDGDDLLDHNGMACLFHNLGYALCAQGREGEAIAFFTRQIKILRETKGDEHPDTIDLIRRVNEIAKKEEKLSPAAQLSESASILFKQGKMTTAEALYRLVEEIIRSVVGEAHPHYATVLCNLSNVLRIQGNYTEAKAYSKRAIQILQQIFDPRNPRIAQAQKELALILKHQGRHEEADAPEAASQACGEEACDEHNGDQPQNNQTSPWQHEDQAQLEEDFEDYTTCLTLLQGADSTNMRRSVIFSRAMNLFRQRKFEDCVTDCSAALELDPSVAGVFCLRCLAWSELGESTKALADATHALELDPDSREAAALVARLMEVAETEAAHDK